LLGLEEKAKTETRLDMILRSGGTLFIFHWVQKNLDESLRLASALAAAGEQASWKTFLFF
jgi:hypothetical protein